MAAPNINVPGLTNSVTVPPITSAFNVGENGSNISLTDNLGNVYNLGKVLDFHFTPKFHDVTLQTLNYQGREITQTERIGGTGTITVARQDGTMEQVEYIQQQRKRAGLPELYFTVYQFISNPDGSQNELMFVNCRVRLTDAGQYKLGQAVEQKVEFIYEDMYKVQ